MAEKFCHRINFICPVRSQCPAIFFWEAMEMKYGLEGKFNNREVKRHEKHIACILINGNMYFLRG